MPASDSVSYSGSAALTRIIRDFADKRSLLCYKHVDETMFEAHSEASSCLTIAQHSVGCSQEFFASRWLLNVISGRVVPERAVLLLQRDQLTLRVHACIAAGIMQQHESQQTDILRFAAHQLAKSPP